MLCKHLLLSVLLSASALVLAMPSLAQVNLPHIFQPNTPAKAGEVNDNFDALKAAIQAQQQTIAALQSQLAALQNNTVLQLDGKLGLGTDPATGKPTARFTAVNVQIVNGTGSTFSTNGLGNLIVGYNEIAGSTAFCSDGVSVSEEGDIEVNDDQATCTSNGGIWAPNQRTGSHNLIVGNKNVYTQYGGLVAGYGNVVNAENSSVSGGENNIALGPVSSVTGGRNNKASGYWSWIGSGSGNTASGSNSSVSSGQLGIASGAYASVNGGYKNTASGYYSTVSAGSENIAAGNSSSVSGGAMNTASGVRSMIGGGKARSVDGENNWRAGALFQDH
jgi:hypothetical protein